MGELMRRYWVPAVLSKQIAEPDSPPVRVQIMGEKLVAFRDSDGRVGILDEQCPHLAPPSVSLTHFSLMTFSMSCTRGTQVPCRRRRSWSIAVRWA